MEVFECGEHSFDVGAMLADIESGRLRPGLHRLPARFWKQYGEKVLGLDRTNPQGRQSKLREIDVRLAVVRRLQSERLAVPAVIAYVGRGKGDLSIDGSHDYVLCDGNHRAARWYLDGPGTHPAYVLSLAQSRRYRSSSAK